ncbi:MAG: NAD(P)H-dependent oxidoreductase subunit E [Bryobacteraceae bacterium]|nr:NAD(P)H-dependent oxidoreductase subunit E [Bryobacteraceae bacterium]
MTPRILRRATVLCGALILACCAVLTFDYFQTRLRAPAEEARIAALQKEVRQDAARAAVLYAEQQRITRARDARNARTQRLKWVLIALSALFVTGAKRIIESPGAKPAPSKLPTQSSKTTRRPIPRPVAGSNGPPAVDLAFVNEVVAREGTGPEAAITILQAIQDHYRYLPEEALERVCEMTAITPAQITGAATFYGRFRRRPVGRHIVRVCHGTACHVAGAREISEQLRRDLAIPDGSDTDPERIFTLEEVACLGCCSLAPVLMVDNHASGKLTPAAAIDALDAAHPREPA